MLLPRLADLGVEGGLVPVEQLLYTLANLGGDVPGFECSYVLPHTALGQKASEKKGVRKKSKGHDSDK